MEKLEAEISLDEARTAHAALNAQLDAVPGERGASAGGGVQQGGLAELQVHHEAEVGDLRTALDACNVQLAAAKAQLDAAVRHAEGLSAQLAATQEAAARREVELKAQHEELKAQHEALKARTPQRFNQVRLAVLTGSGDGGAGARAVGAWTLLTTKLAWH